MLLQEVFDLVFRTGQESCFPLMVRTHTGTRTHPRKHTHVKFFSLWTSPSPQTVLFTVMGKNMHSSQRPDMYIHTHANTQTNTRTHSHGAMKLVLPFLKSDLEHCYFYRSCGMGRWQIWVSSSSSKPRVHSSVVPPQQRHHTSPSERGLN